MHSCRLLQCDTASVTFLLSPSVVSVELAAEVNMLNRYFYLTTRQQALWARRVGRN